MVIASLAGARPLRNDDDNNEVSRLANLFLILFEYYIQHSSPASLELIEALRTLVGLGFTACLSDEIYLACYEPYLNSFLQHDRGNFKKHSGALRLLSKNMAHMVILGINNFRLRHHPPYYQFFMNTIKDILSDMIITETDQLPEAKQVLELLQRKCE